MLRQFILAFAVGAALVAVPGQSKAADMPPIPKLLPPHFLPRLLPAGTGGGGLAAFAAVGLIGIAAAVCAYDIYLKVEGAKNWDGTPKLARSPSHHHRTA